MSTTLGTTNNQTTFHTIDLLRKLIAVFRKHTYAGVDEAMMDTFLLIARYDDKTQGDYVELSGKAQSSVNRYIAKLANMKPLVGRRMAPGLVTTYTDPFDSAGKRKRVRLTDRGHALLKELKEVLSEEGAGRGT